MPEIAVVLRQLVSTFSSAARLFGKVFNSEPLALRPRIAPGLLLSEKSHVLLSLIRFAMNFTPSLLVFLEPIDKEYYKG